MNHLAEANGPFEFQIRMLEKGAAELQLQIGRLDELLLKVKATAVTLWVAIMGWAFTAKIELIVLLGCVVLVGFWLLEALFKGIQLRYIDQSLKFGAFLNNATKVENSFVNKRLPPNFAYPIGIKETELEGAVRFATRVITPTILTLYLFLGLINFFIWMVVSANGFEDFAKPN